MLATNLIKRHPVTVALVLSQAVTIILLARAYQIIDATETWTIEHDVSISRLQSRTDGVDARLRETEDQMRSLEANLDGLREAANSSQPARN